MQLISAHHSEVYLVLKGIFPSVNIWNKYDMFKVDSPPKNQQPQQKNQPLFLKASLIYVKQSIFNIVCNQLLQGPPFPRPQMKAVMVVRPFPHYNMVRFCNDNKCLQQQLTFTECYVPGPVACALQRCLSSAQHPHEVGRYCHHSDFMREKHEAGASKSPTRRHTQQAGRRQELRSDSKTGAFDNFSKL